jgi:D-3-phosphoglycerate dehydrogenase / 2-oxoglutarate reductase
MKASHKVIFINNPHPVIQQKLEKAGYVCEMATDIPKEDVEKIINEFFGLIINSRFFIDKQFIEKAAKLRFIGRVGSGMESIDVAYAESKGIHCFNSPEGNRDAVGEHALGLLLSLMNKISVADKQVRQLIWRREENRGVEIKGKTVGIIGYGNMGSAFARRLKGFEAEVIAYDKYKKGFSDEFATECKLEDIFKRADIVGLHVPLTEETNYMVDSAFIGKFVKPFFLINTARGKVVNTADLVIALKNEKIRGAALDVLEYEDISFEKMNADHLPEPLKYLFEADNVVLTPHIAGWTVESKYKLADVLAEKILEKFPKGIV